MQGEKATVVPSGAWQNLNVFSESAFGEEMKAGSFAPLCAKITIRPWHDLLLGNELRRNWHRIGPLRSRRKSKQNPQNPRAQKIDISIGLNIACG